MLVSLSICHNVIIEKEEEDASPAPVVIEKAIKYNASSPDELAFINMAKYCGWDY